MSERPIIDWPVWLVSPPGRYALAWEQALFDQWVGDLFGYHALQLGRPELDTLRENRMPYRGLVLPAPRGPEAPPLMTKAASDTTGITPANAAGPIGMVPRDILVSRYDELPIATASTDLVVLPHVLEFAENPHDILREVERILVPEGQVIITGFNNLSLWGAREELGKLAGAPFLPPGADLIAFTRLKDWLKLLSFDIDRGRFGCYRPPLRGEHWLQRFEFMEPAGDRWWPIFGALYAVRAVKRVRGMRLVGKVRKRILGLQPAAAPVATPNTTHCQMADATDGPERLFER
ncbi:methyltransferase domain-containing protein [Pandoraea nosoerga]|uniref:SAM-dependent methyltransferase n=1 Tax=Pandoraea nosoerga TaxID=2508296 RepID=A0A5E4U0T9_9BURK|nr:methyltransferase domain-containing protein [Pandoraea nosoerga]MBN4666610.1 methyltransferase domain-containing protein [Pandoraea nosoerga]MBN4676805.1 methyltransferase domain-containing protein [Pandoraea nosoerga]MBN4682617.1 methyltransferase domain-containing protein [Pandoraea nosoerga]MBN4745785.1 methyltransferase domain-containing protein [Pandoraea nosoerga]VVD92638.1 SAM-dependent methyltransferase [Pandoraea nosoerga]